MTRYYAGIGSRETPSNVLDLMTRIARKLESEGYILRSGGAKGADSAFEKGVLNSINTSIYYAKDGANAPQWAIDKAAAACSYKPLSTMKPFVANLITRNMFQLFGLTQLGLEDIPSEFVICWTSNGKDAGGTGYAIRAGRQARIPIVNLYHQLMRDKMEAWLLK